jgi:secreted PhoX family phosphatase
VHDNDDTISNTSNNPHLNDIIDPPLADPARRGMFRSGLGAATLAFFGAGAALTGCGGDDDSPAPAPAAPPAPATTPPPPPVLQFSAVPVSTGDEVIVPAGYVATAIFPWGDPIRAGAPAFARDASQGWQEQEQQVGDNHDGMHFFPFNAAADNLGTRSDEGLLVMNHEYVNPEYLYAPGTDPADWLLPFTNDKVRKALAAHGVSVLHVQRSASGVISHKADSPFNRRITGYTPMTITGPAAGHPLLQTAADPTGREVLGTLNNCAHGYTPWGTYLTCEENFNGYFGWNGTRTPTVLENRYGVTQTGFGYRWHTADPRFDVAATPNEPNRHGWVVEIDPFDPASKPVKRTALGRFKHENAEHVVAADGTVVVYMGDDERNEYIYKFVSSGKFDASNPRSPANRNLLDSGTLYVAKFEGSTPGRGTGTWIALVQGQNGLTDANGFPDQASILINTRAAADRVGATMMDRPEWITVNPNKLGEVFCTLTNNNRRGTTPASANNVAGTTVAGSARPAVDAVNPRSNNLWGHIVRWNEANGDPRALTFSWDLFLLAGLPTVTGERAPSSTINTQNIFNSPDGLWFDRNGRLWIQSDGSFSNTGDFANMGNNQMLCADPATGEVRRFLVGPSGCEVTGVVMTPDSRTMFVNIQHPGELGSHPRVPRKAPTGQQQVGAPYTENDIAREPTMFSRFPEGALSGRPRSSTVVVRKLDGGVIGT